MTDVPPHPHAGAPGRDQARAILRGVAVDVRCGLHPWERHPERPNRLKVDVDMFSDWPVGGAGYVDYDRVRDHILGWAGRAHVDLLETLLAELSEVVFQDPAVTACRIRIVKPDIFAETDAAGVEIFRLRPAG